MAMIKFKVDFPTHPIGLLLIGLAIAQFLATIQVYLSNLDLYATVSAVDAAGYLAIPNRKVMGSLQNFAPAFFGGLFFTFTIGSGITLGAMAAAWIWIRVFLRKKLVLLLFFFVWGIVLLLINSHGANPIATLYFFLIPPVLFKLTAKSLAHADVPSRRIQRLVHLIPIPLLALLWFTQFDREMFSDLRDNLLLSNPWGRKFSNFYYTYTLYPAEAFKSLDQKMMKTCGLENIQDQAVKLRLENRLMANSYLPMPEIAKVDLKLTQKEAILEFRADGQIIFLIPATQFLSDSQKTLQKFSDQIDRNTIFRQLTFLSLLIGFPVLIYILLHAILYFLFSPILGPKKAMLTASMVCLLIGIVVLVFFQTNRSANIDIQDLAYALRSEKWQTRLAALKMIYRKRLDIADYQAYPGLLKSRIPQERYWLARTLAFSRKADTYRDLLNFLNDKNTNVQTMAFYSLGQRKDRRAIKLILEKIELSDNWYIQMYAFNALRSLGWEQTKSR